MSSPPERISIIVCTFNRSQRLRECVTSLWRLGNEVVRPWEIVVVDNGSTDDTAEVLADLAADSPIPLRRIAELTPGPAAARNAGMAAACGDWLAFIDDDETADAAWLDELTLLARRRRAYIVGGAVQLRCPDHTIEPAALELLAPGGRDPRERTFNLRYSLNSGNQMLHRGVLDRVGYYAVGWTQGGEDSEYFTRVQSAGLEAWYTPSAIVHHYVPEYRLRWDYLRWLSLRQGWLSTRADWSSGGLWWAWGRGLPRLAACLTRAAVSRSVGARRGDAGRPAKLPADLSVASRWWRATGVWRSLWYHTAPAYFAQTSFRDYIDFRSERALFAAAIAPDCEAPAAAPAASGVAS